MEIFEYKEELWFVNINKLIEFSNISLEKIGISKQHKNRIDSKGKFFEVEFIIVRILKFSFIDSEYIPNFNKNQLRYLRLFKNLKLRTRDLKVSKVIQSLKCVKYLGKK